MRGQIRHIGLTHPITITPQRHSSSSDFETPIRELAAQHFGDRSYPAELPPVRVLSGLDGTTGLVKDCGMAGRLNDRSDASIHTHPIK